MASETGMEMSQLSPANTTERYETGATSTNAKVVTQAVVHGGPFYGSRHGNGFGFEHADEVSVSEGKDNGTTNGTGHGDDKEAGIACGGGGGGGTNPVIASMDVRLEIDRADADQDGMPLVPPQVRVRSDSWLAGVTANSSEVAEKSEFEFIKDEKEAWSTNQMISGDFWHDTDSTHIRRNGIRGRCSKICSQVCYIDSHQLFVCFALSSHFCTPVPVWLRTV